MHVSPDVQALMDRWTDEEHHQHREHFQRTIAPTAAMTYLEYLQKIVLGNWLENISHGDGAHTHRADFAANGFGKFDPTRSRMSYPHKARPTSGSSPAHDHRRGMGGRDHEAFYSDESFPREYGGRRAEGGSGNPLLRTQSGEANPYSPVHGDTGYSTGEPPGLGGRHHRHRASRMPLSEHPAAESSFIDASSRQHGSQQDPYSQGRHDSYDSLEWSRYPAGRRPEER